MQVVTRKSDQAMSGRQRVGRAVAFRGPDRVPRSHGIPEAAYEKHGERLRELVRRYPGDFGWNGWQPGPDSPRPVEVSDTEWVDEWDVTWRRSQAGLMGMPVGHPLADWDRFAFYRVPRTLHGDFTGVREALSAERHDKWVDAYGGRLFERMQWLRGAGNLLADLASPPPRLYELRDRIVESYLEAIEFWLQYETDAVGFEDDWGSQRSLMISPEVWRSFFRPAYERLFAPVLAAGRVVFFHSDGMVWEILPELLDLGVSHLNVQYGLLGLERLGREYGGSVCFACDLEGQFVMANAGPEQVREHVRQVVAHLGRPAGGLTLDTWVTPDVPWENVEAMFSAFAEFGGWE
jgi:uroporphyrinogen decarboxylase